MTGGSLPQAKVRHLPSHRNLDTGALPSLVIIFPKSGFLMLEKDIPGLQTWGEVFRRFTLQSQRNNLQLQVFKVNVLIKERSETLKS